MKYLINASFKALRFGEFVKADESAEEFIFDSESCEDISVATLLEIGKKNGAKLKKEKKDDVVEKLVEHLTSLGLPEMSEKTDTQIVEEIVKAGVDAGKDDEEILQDIALTGKIKFKLINRLFTQVMTANGYRITSKERKAQGREMLVDAEFSPETYDEVEAMLEKMSETIPDTTTSQAFGVIKAYAKEFEILIPRPPKKVKGSLRARAMDWMVKNPEASKEDLSTWIEEVAKKDDPEGKILGRMWDVFSFGKDMIKAAG